MNAVRFIHAADLHLDSPFKGLNYLPAEIFGQVRNSTFKALSTLVEKAIEERVDFLLLAGDLFDLEQRSLLAQARLRHEFLRLKKENILVYVIHGNHDYITKAHRMFRYPDNVHIFQEEVEAMPFIKDGVHLANIYGFSYSKRHIVENMTRFYKKQNHDIPFHIGMLHGNLTGREDHDPYAPFTIGELLEKDFNYWGLGHIHKREILYTKPPIVYPGNIQGRNKKELGEKGCYLVELKEKDAELTFLETSPIVWNSVEVSIQDVPTWDGLIDRTKAELDAARQDGKGILVQLVLTGNGELHAALQDENQLEDLIAILNEGETLQTSFLYIYSLSVQTMVPYLKSDLEKMSFYQDFYGMVEQTTTDDIDSCLSTLYRHSEARHFLEQLQDEEKQAILNEAEQWLVTKFMENEKR